MHRQLKISFSLKTAYVAGLCLGWCTASPAADYHIDAAGGNDSKNGLSPANAWQTLSRASSQNYSAGDRILLKRGETFPGRLQITYELSGTAANPIIVSTYGPSANRPVIDATGQNHAVELGNSDYIEVEDLEITGATQHGIYVATWGSGGQTAYAGPKLRNLYIHGVGGAGITMLTNNDYDRYFKDILIADCVIADIGGAGMAVNKWNQFTAVDVFHENLTVTNNTIMNTDGAGMQFGKIRNGLVEGNTTTATGDGTGGSSGIWTWFCGTPSTAFVVQRNVFSGARGETDACGAHIDIGCVNTIFQYNLSIDNEGGFMEILGLASNCVYRYNVSINDGSRVNGVNGARQHGKTFWIGGYTGQGNPRLGAYNSYIYNNTIFVKSDVVSRYKMEDTASGALFANNVIYVEGSASDISTDWPGGPGTGIIFDNNLVFENKVPTTPWNTSSNNWAADPQYLNRGGLDAEDYKAVNFSQIINRGINLYHIPGDPYGVAGGFEVMEDILGNPIVGLPDMGAIEVESEFAALLAWMDGHGIPRDADLASDLNGDGVSLLSAYSQNLDPHLDLSGMVPVLEHNRAADTMDMIFYALADNMAYEVQETASLTNSWGGFTSGTMTGPDGAGNITARVPLTNSAGRLFLKLRITLE
jgi:hypothetical protein